MTRMCHNKIIQGGDQLELFYYRCSEERRDRCYRFSPKIKITIIVYKKVYLT